MKGKSMDTSEAAALPCPSPPSPSSLISHFSAGRHFYVAVDRYHFKMETLVDLLKVAGRRPSLPIVVCCSSRDELDGVCAAVSNLSFISLNPLWNQNSTFLGGNDLESGTANQKSCTVVFTDACLPLVTAGEATLSALILINYELPIKKETYWRRISTCLAADGIVINIVVGGEVIILKGIEESIGIAIAIAEIPEMFIHFRSIYIIGSYCRYLRCCEDLFC